ncbi:D-methionine transport system substrate-binding protein [Anaerosolibacter carboniphilus]|uniref:Lipoprotein n=1 Tax=Anaerosolibacter carboniphilus TaxID=1417629 RepID=A0A841KUS5_9FIRM|nr:MetQ/NlpA family ABC transporter substrate-binding protein [Anaerosolibacter carboniphilus]MBB6213935.1 D-methionine transport system substrate-binding protein [Anaerosolibacter carboniphilus]
MKKSILISILGLIILSFVFSGCTPAAPAAEKDVAKDATQETAAVTLKVGATPVPHAELLEFVKPLLKEQGIELEIVEFTDYVNPNLALDSKELDANFFQHVPYMDTFSKERGIELVSVGKVHVEPLGLYSKKIKTIDELQDKAVIAIPNDPTNEGRALILLDTAGIIKLKDDAGLEATEKDIAENPKNLVFKPIDAAQLPRTLEDVDASIINTNYALEAGLNPVKDSIIIEGSDSPYANIVTARPDNQNDENIKKLIETLQTPEVKDFIEETYKGAVVPAF